MSNSTVARPVSQDGAHWYTKAGVASHEQPKADGSGMTATTLRHARKLGLLPSVTTILRCLDKPALTTWKIEQAVLTAVTAPRIEGEDIDAFIKRVLHTEKQQEQEAEKARDLGTDVHDAIEAICNGLSFLPEFKPYVEPAWAELMKLGRVVSSEKIVVGNGYAGKLDCFMEGEVLTLVDFKTTKTLPKESYNEHRLQLAAYANALGSTSDKRLRTANLYISTKEPGKVQLCVNEDWQSDFMAFDHLVKFWQIINDYAP